MFKVTYIFPVLTLAAALCGNTGAHSAPGAGATSTNVTPMSIKAGKAQQFRTVAGNPSLTTWYVNGVAGGNTRVGKVNSGGLYTAPATAPDVDIELTVADASNGRTSLIARIKVLDDPSILEAHQKWMDGAVEAAAVYGCAHPAIQQSTESVADALKVYILTADKSSCLILSPISSDRDSNRYSYAWGGNVDGVDIFYMSDVGRPRILLGDPVPGE